MGSEPEKARVIDGFFILLVRSVISDPVILRCFLSCCFRTEYRSVRKIFLVNDCELIYFAEVRTQWDGTS